MSKHAGIQRARSKQRQPRPTPSGEKVRVPIWKNDLFDIGILDFCHVPWPSCGLYLALWGTVGFISIIEMYLVFAFLEFRRKPFRRWLQNWHGAQGPLEVEISSSFSRISCSCRWSLGELWWSCHWVWTTPTRRRVFAQSGPVYLISVW